MDNGYWTKFEVKRVEPNENIPHGIKPNKGKFKSKKTEWDQKHEKSKVRTYEFKNAGELLDDFWKDVSEVIDNP